MDTAICSCQQEYLFLAIKQGWVTDVERCINSCPCLIHKLYHNLTPLLVAIMTNQYLSTKALLDARAEVNTLHGSTTPLIAAILANNYCIVELLLNHGANVNRPCTDTTFMNYNTLTPLQAAIELENTPIIQLLLEHSCAIDSCALQCAIRTSPEMVHVIHEALLLPHNAGQTTHQMMTDAILSAIKENDVESVHLFVKSPLVLLDILCNPLIMDCADDLGNINMIGLLGIHGAVFSI